MSGQFPAPWYAYRPAYESTIRRICTACRRGFVFQTKTHCGCGAELRELLMPMRSEEFHRLDDEARQDLQTRRIS